MECDLFWPEGDAVSLGKSIGKDIEEEYFGSLLESTCIKTRNTPIYALQLCVNKISSTLWKTETSLSRIQIYFIKPFNISCTSTLKIGAINFFYYYSCISSVCLLLLVICFDMLSDLSVGEVWFLCKSPQKMLMLICFETFHCAKLRNRGGFQYYFSTLCIGHFSQFSPPLCFDSDCNR